MRAMEEERERTGEEIVKEMLRCVVAVAQVTNVWRWGDGEGGAVHVWLDEVAREGA